MTPNPPQQEKQACGCPPGGQCTRHDWDLHQPTDDMVNMQATIPHHIDDHFSSLEEMAGTGEVETLGG